MYIVTLSHDAAFLLADFSVFTVQFHFPSSRTMTTLNTASSLQTMYHGRAREQLLVTLFPRSSLLILRSLVGPPACLILLSESSGP